MSGTITMTGEEYDALHAEAEALRVVLHEIASVNPAERGIEWAKSYASDGLKGAGSELYARWLDTFKEAEALRAENGHWKGMHAGSMALRMSAEFERDELRTELEAARGLLREVRQRCQLPDWARSRIDKLTATPAPEVPDHIADASKMVEQRAITVERDFIGTMHIKVGDFDAVQVRYQYPYTDNASTRRLAERIADMLRNPQAEQGERQEAVAWALANSADEIGGFAPIYYTKEGAISWANGRNIFPLYTTRSQARTCGRWLPLFTRHAEHTTCRSAFSTRLARLPMANRSRT